MKYQLSFFLFHRDLRLQDNTGLHEALQTSTFVVPIFILDEDQLERNTYRSEAAVAFMCESLNELSRELQIHGSQLYIFKGKTHLVLQELFTHLRPQAFFTNADYTPFSRRRDAAILEQCTKIGIEFFRIEDALLCDPRTLFTKQGTPFTVFTPFKRALLQREVCLPQKNTTYTFYAQPIANAYAHVDKTVVPYTAVQCSIVQGGRSEALALLAAVTGQVEYAQTRNIPALHSTTKLSPHHKFGTISIRETFATIQSLFDLDHPLISECIWRDFFTYIAYHFPHVFTGPFHTKYKALQWSTNEAHVTAWQTGFTGFPIVDAGMRELQATGFMHNRVRMITASFLVKDLHIHWQKGERYFAQKLIDYDPAVNNGNWQWVASTGCDSQPYFRIFNPWLQQQKFDAQAQYIKKWIPELALVPVADIHAWNTRYSSYAVGYPAPICDHAIEAAHTKTLYAACRLL